MANDDRGKLLQATRRLVKGFAPQRIILFGSQARGTADARSDFDLLVVLPMHGNRRRLIVEMDRVLDGLEIARSAAIEGLVLFERNE